MENDLVKKLEQIVGPDNVTDKKFEMLAYSRDWSYEGPLLPDIVITPGSTEEVSEIMKLANKTKTPVCVRGGGTTAAGTGHRSEALWTRTRSTVLPTMSGSIPRRVVSTSGSSGITTYASEQDVHDRKRFIHKD